MIAYLLEVSLCWLIFYLLYYFWLSKETFFHLNRWYLLGTLFLGLIIPVIPSPFAGAQESEWVTLYVAPINMGLESLQVTVSAPGDAGMQFDWLALLKWVYWGGVCFTAFRFLSGLWRIGTLYWRAEHIQVGQYPVALTDEPHLPFSFFRVVFKSKLGNLDDFAEEKITDHELAHVRGWHTIDVLLVELVSIFLWCSPPVYLYRRSLRIVHEYIADSAAIRTGQKKKYGHLLIRQSQSGLQLALANHFIQSQLKKRIMMMTKTRSRRQAFLKYLPVIPLLVVAFVVFSNWEAVASDPMNLLSENVIENIQTMKPVVADNYDPRILKKQLSAILYKRQQVEENHDAKIARSFASLHDDWAKKYPDHQQEIRSIAEEVAEHYDLAIKFDDAIIGEAYFKHPFKALKEAKEHTIKGSSEAGVKLKLSGEGNPYVLIDDQPATGNWKAQLKPEEIERVEVLKGESAIEAYGEQAKDGAIRIYTKGFEQETPLKVEEPYVVINNEPAPADWETSLDKTNIASVNVLKGEAALEAYGEKAKNGAIQIYTKDFKKANNEDKVEEAPTAKIIISKLKDAQKSPLYIIDGVILENGEINNLDPDEIEKIDVLKGESAIKAYGDRGANGVVRIYTKEASNYDQNPIFPGCEDLEGPDQVRCSEENFLRSIYRQITYPASAREKHIEGMIVVKYTIDKSGKVTNVRIQRGIDEALDNEVLRVINTLPDWQPAKKDGKAVAVDIALPVRFKIENDSEISKAAKKAMLEDNLKESKKAFIEKAADGGEIDNIADEVVVVGYGRTQAKREGVLVVEEMPRFPGCEGENAALRSACAQRKMLEFVYTNITYPKEAKKAGTSGTVIASFIVAKDGNIRDVQIERGLGHGLNEQVLDAINKMPDWVPGRQDGKAVDVIVNLPVKFKLDKSEKQPATSPNIPKQQPTDQLLDLKNFKATPNPSSGMVNLRFQSEAQPLQLRILSTYGQVVYQRNLSQFDGSFDEMIDLQDAPKGTLYISVQQGDKMYTSTIILQ